MEWFGNLACNKIRLEVSIDVVSPFAEPHVLVFEGFHNKWLLLAVEPELAERFDRWVDAINHSKYPHCRPDFGIFSDVIICPEELKRSVGRLKRLPINVVELEIKDRRIFGTLFRVFAIGLRLNRFMLRPICDRKRRQLLLYIFY